jgi:hypothetical protein
MEYSSRELLCLLSSMNEIKESQEKILTAVTNLETRLTKIEINVDTIITSQKKKMRLKVKDGVYHNYRNECNFISAQHTQHTQPININTIKLCVLTTNHVSVVFFSSLEFAFCILLIESIFLELEVREARITHPLIAMYKELEYCDNNNQLDTKTITNRIHTWLHEQSYLNSFPFKINKNIDIDRRMKKKIPASSSLLGYYDNNWCSSSFKNTLVDLYNSFTFQIVKQFGMWQREHAVEIEQNKLYNNLDYNECVLKIMGNQEDISVYSKSITQICEYLSQIC